MYIAFLRSIPPQKYDEAIKSIDSRAAEAFEEGLFEMLDKLEGADDERLKQLAQQDSQLFRLAWIMKQKNLTSVRQLAELLREYRSSLESQQQAFAERLLGQQAMRGSIKVDPEITHDEMVSYYQEHRDDFHVPARARWQQITIRFDHFNSKAEAGQRIAELGNEIFFGAPFWAVAQRNSHGAYAEKGGEHDWTEWGDLQVSRQVNDKVFTLPINELSGIIEDAEGFHIIRVLAREEEHYVSFEEAQPTIKSKLQSQKRNVQVTKYIARLREQTPIYLPGDGDGGPTWR